MSTTIRLDDDLEKKLRQVADSKQLSKSDVIREALLDYFGRHVIDESPYVLGETVFGLYGSGESTRSADRKSIVKSKLHDKRNR